jgi:hypothetical protein
MSDRRLIGATINIDVLNQIKTCKAESAEILLLAIMVMLLMAKL